MSGSLTDTCKAERGNQTCLSHKIVRYPSVCLMIVHYARHKIFSVPTSLMWMTTLKIHFCRAEWRRLVLSLAADFLAVQESSTNPVAQAASTNPRSTLLKCGNRHVGIRQQLPYALCVGHHPGITWKGGEAGADFCHLGW